MKPIKIALLSLAVVSLCSAEALAQLPAPIAFYSLNGSTNDTSGSGFNGVVNGNTNYASGTLGQQAFQFDGNTTIAAATTDQLGIYNGSFSEDSWVNFSNLTGGIDNNSFALFGTLPGGTDQGLQLIVRGDQPYFGFYADDNGSTYTVTTGTWYNIAYTYDASTKTQSIYVNGTLVGQGTVNNNFLGTGETAYIGGSCCGTDPTGLIQDVGVYNTALTQSQVTAFYQTQSWVVGPAVTWTGTAGTGAYTGLPNGTTGIWDSTNSSSPNAPTANWTGAATTYTDGDSVTFDDTGINSNIAIQSGGVAPQSVAFNNTNTPGTGVAYSFIDADGVNGITGTASVTLSGGGSVTFSGANSYTGATTITAGTLELADPNALQNSTATVNVNGGLLFGPMVGTFNLGGLAGTGNINLVDANSQPVTISVGANNESTLYSGVLSGLGGGLTKVGSGTLRLGSANTYSGPTMISAGTIQLNVAGALQNSPVTVNSTNGLAFGSGVGTFNLVSLAGSGSINLVDTNNQPVTLSVGSSNQSTLFSGTLRDGGLGGGLTKVGSGTLTLALGSANTYSGPTTINAGVVQIDDPNSLENSTATVNVTSGLAFGPSVGTFNLGGLAGTSNIGLVDSNTQPVTLSVGANNASTVYSGVLSDSGLGGALTKVGTGTLALGSVNTYSGPTTVNAGALQLNVAGALQNSPVTANANGQLAFGSGVGTFNLVSLAGSGNFALTDTANQPVNLSVGSNNASTSYGGVLRGGGTLTKVGSGVLTLANTSTFTGATYVTSGTLRLAATTVPGLYEGIVANGTNAFDITDPIPTSGPNSNGIALTTRLANSTAQQQVWPTGIPDNSTVGYTGYINNPTSNPVTYTFAENFDDNVYLTIDGNVVLNDTTWNNPTTGTITIAPGLHTFDLYLGQGGGGVGPAGGGLFNGAGGADGLGVGYTTVVGSTNASDYLPLTDPGNGSLFDVGSVPSLAGSVVMSTSTTLDVTNQTASIGSLADASGGETGAQVLLGTSGTLTTGTDNTSTIFSGVISGSGGNLIKTGTGTFTLAGANTYGGSTTINGGAIQLNVANALQNSTATVNVNGGLAFGPSVGTFNVGALTGSGNIALADTSNQPVNLSVGANGASTSYSGSLTGSGGLTKAGTGTLTLGGTNTYQGATIVQGGTLRMAPTQPPVTTGLITQLDASTLAPGALSSWTDLSGSGYSLVPGSGSTDPTVVAGGMNGRNVVQLNGSQWIYAPQNNTSTSYTIFTVAAMNTTTGTQRLIGSANENDLIGWWNGSANDLYLGGWVNGAGANPPDSTAVNTATHLYAATVNGSTGTTTFYDLANSLTPLASNTGGSQILGELELGGYNGGNELSNGTVAEVDVFNGVLSPTQIAEVQAYLQAKWMGIGSPANGTTLPSGSPLQLAGGASLDLNGTTQTAASLGDYNGTGGTVTNSGYAPATLTLAPPSGSATFTGVIQNGNGTVSLTLNGAGTQVLGGANTYTGPTTILSGTLRVNGSLAAGSTVRVGGAGASGTPALAGSGTIAGPVTVFGSGAGSVAGHLAPGGYLAGGTSAQLNLTGGLSLGSGANLDFNLNNMAAEGSAGGNDLVSITGASGTVNYAPGGVVNINAYAGSLADGTYTLIDDSAGPTPTAASYSSIWTIGTNNDANAATSAYVVTVVGKNLDLTVSPQLTWGGQTSGLWTDSPPNWYAGSTPTAFTTQAVAFGDTQYSPGGPPVTNNDVTVTSPVSPAAVTFNNNSVPYTIDTTGDTSNTGITGSTGMTLNGSQPVTLVGPNTYTGQTLLNSGSTLVISDVGSIGSTSAPLTFNGGTLQYSASSTANTDISTHTVTIAGGGATIDLNGNNVSYANSIGNNGAGALALKNSGAAASLTLGGANTYTGGTTINSGNVTLISTSGSSLGTGPLTFAAAGGTLRLSGTAQTVPGLLNAYYLAGYNNIPAPGTGQFSSYANIQSTFGGLTPYPGVFLSSNSNGTNSISTYFYGGSNNGTYENFTANTNGNQLNGANGGNGTNFSIVSSGKINITTSDTYTFATTSDDGSMLFIYANGQWNNVVYNDYGQGYTQRSGQIALTPGQYPIEIAYFEGGGGFSLSAQGEEGAFADIPNPNDNNNISSAQPSPYDLQFSTTANMGLSVTLVPNQNYSNPVVVNANATIDLGNVSAASFGPLTIGSSQLNVLASAPNGSGLPQTVAMGAVTLTGNPTFDVASSGGTLYLGALNDGGTARTITFQDAGMTTLTAAATSLVQNTVVNISGGNLTAGASAALGSTAQLNFSNSGTFTLSAGVSQTISSIAGDGTGRVNLNNGTLRIGSTDNLSSTYAGSFTSSSGGTLIQAGTGTLTLSGNSTAGIASGTQVRVNGGGLITNSSDALGTFAQVTVASSSSWTLGANNQQVSALSGSGTVTLNGNALTVGNTDNISSAFAGVIADGTPAGGSLRKNGTGTFTITAANTYTGGTTVSAGVLAVGPFLSSNSSTPISSGLVTLSGGTLALLGPTTSGTLISATNSFGGTSTSVTGGGTPWVVNNNGITSNPINSNVLTLTDGANNEARSAFYGTPVNYTTGFTASFNYTESGGGTTPADGFAFMLQNATNGTAALGGGGGNIGYQGITPSAAVEFEIYSGAAGYFGRTGFGTNGNITEPNASTAVNLNSGDPITVTVTYTPSSGGTVTETLLDTVTQATQTFTYTGENLSSILGSNAAYLGFSGGTGGANSTQEISDLQVAAQAPASTSTYANNVSVINNSTSGISVSGSLNVTMGDLAINGTLNATSPDTSGSPYSLTFMGTTGITTLTGNATFNVSNSAGGGAGTLNLGALNFGGTARTISFGGTGTTNLSYQAQNEVAGTQVVITGGTLNSNVGGTDTSPGSLGSFAQVNVYNGATLAVNASQTISSLAGTGNVNIGNNTLTIGNTDNITATSPFGGTISDGGAGSPGSIIKAGGGTLYLTGANTYNGGTTVLAGTLAVGSSSSLGSGAVTLTGGKLQLAGFQPSINNGNAFGIHFGVDQNGGQDILTPTMAAGVPSSITGGPSYVMSNWNNASGANGTTANVFSGATSGVLVNSQGSALSGVSVSWTSGGTYSTNRTPVNNDDALMGSFLNDGGGDTVTISNIPYAQYEVITYVGSEGANNRNALLTVTGSTSGTTSYYFQTDTNPGSNPFNYSQITNTNSSSYQLGNFAVTTDVTGSTLTVYDHNQSSNNAGMPAVEIINTSPGVTTLTLPNAVVVNGPSTIDLTGTGADSITGGLTLGTTLLTVSGGSTGTNVPYTLTVTGQTTLTGSPIITVSNNGSGAGNLVLQGGLNGNNAPATLTLTGNGAVTLQGSATGIVAGTVVNIYNGTLNSDNPNALGTTSTVNVYAGTSFNLGSGASQTLSGLGGSGTVNLGANTLTVGGSDNLVSTFSGTLRDGGAGGSLAIGANGFAGKFTLAGTAAYSGPTTVNSGTFALATSGSIGNNAITVNSGGTFAPQLINDTGHIIGNSGSGSAGATLALNGGTLDLTSGGSSSAIGPFTLKQQSSFTGAALSINSATLDFGVSSSGADELVVGGPTASASVSGTNIINVGGVGSSLSSGAQYTIISSPNGGLSGTFEFSNDSTSEIISVGGTGYRLSLGNTATAETLGIGISVSSVWQLTNGGNWSSPTSNWSGNTVPQVPGDAATFGVTSNTDQTVYVDQSTISVGSLTFNNGNGGTVGTGAYDIAAPNGSPNNTLVLNNGGSGFTATVTNETNNNTISAPLSLVSKVTADIATGTQLTLSGQVSGSTALAINPDSPNAGTLVISATNTGYSGPISLYAGTLNFSSGSLGSGASTNTLTFAGNSTLQYASGNSQDISSQIQTIPSGVTATIEIDGSNSVTFNSGLSGTDTTSGLTKTGTGTLTLSGINTYQGLTTVSAGKLGVNGSLAGGVSVGVNGTLGGSFGTVNGAATISGTLAPSLGQMTGGTTLTFANGLTLNSGATLSVNLSLSPDGADYTTANQSSPYNDHVTVTSGNVSLNGGTIKIIPYETSLGTGTYELIADTSATGSISNSGIWNISGTPAGDTATVAVNQADGISQFDLIVTTSVVSGSASWNNANGGDWSVATNWNPNSVPGVGNTATFSISASEPVTINNGPESAGSLVFTNSYTISGSDTLTLNNGSGGGTSVSVSNGAFTFITANIVLADANNSTMFDIDGSTGSQLVLAGTVGTPSDGQAIVLTGGGILELSATNAYSGGTTVQNGTLLIDSGATPGTGGLTFAPSTASFVATVNVDNSFTSGNLNQTSTAGSANLNIGPDVAATLTINQTTPGTFAGNLSVNSGSGLIVNASGTSLTFSGASNFGGNNAITVNSGTLAFTNSAAATISGAVTVTVQPTATLQLAGSASALSNSDGTNPATINNHGSLASNGGLYVTAGNQTVGVITGTASVSGPTTYDGDTVVGSDSTTANLTATQILQNSLTINAGSTVTIAPAGDPPSGNGSAIPAASGASASSAAVATESDGSSSSDPFTAIQAAVGAGAISSTTGQVLDNRIAAIERLAAADPGLDASLLEDRVLAVLPSAFWSSAADSSPASDVGSGMLAMDSSALASGSSANASAAFASGASFAGSPAAVPEPSALVLIAIAAIGLALVALRRKRWAAAK